MADVQHERQSTQTVLATVPEKQQTADAGAGYSGPVSPRSLTDPRRLSSHDVLYLQRTIGNCAVTAFLRPPCADAARTTVPAQQDGAGTPARAAPPVRLSPILSTHRAFVVQRKMQPGVTTKETAAYTPTPSKDLTKSTRHFESGEPVMVDNDSIYVVGDDESKPDYHLLGFQVDNKKAYLPEDAYKHTTSSLAGLMGLLHQVWKNKDEILSVKQPIYNMYNDVYTTKQLSTLSSDQYMEQVAKIIEGRAADAITQSQVKGSVTAQDIRAQGGQAWDTDFIHFRRKRSDQTGATAERVYLNVAADHVPTVMGHIVTTMVDDPKAFPGVTNAKLGGRKDVTSRTDTIVIYTTGGDGTKQVVDHMNDFILQNAGYFETEVPLMTEQVAKGMSTGAEPAVGYASAEPYYPNVDAFKDILDMIVKAVRGVWEGLPKPNKEYFRQTIRSARKEIEQGKISQRTGSDLLDMAHALEGVPEPTSPAQALPQGQPLKQDPGKIKQNPKDAQTSFGGLRTSLIYDALYAEHADFEKFVEKVKTKFTEGKVKFEQPSENLP